MEVLGVTSSIIAVLQLTTTVVKYLAGVKNATKDQKQCLTEASNLVVLLTKLKFRLDEANSTDPWFSSIRDLTVINGPLSQHKAAAKRLVSFIVPKSDVGKLTAALVWPLNKGEVADILAAMERLKSFINIALELDHFKLSEAIKNETRLIPTVANDVETIRCNQDDQQAKAIVNQRTRDILDWLYSTDVSQELERFSRERSEGTGVWFIESPEFIDWRDGQTTTLFCPGKPGAGKTILSSLVIEHLQMYLDTTKDGLAFLLCDYMEQSERRAIDLLLAILRQLLSGLTMMPDAVQALYDLHDKGKSRPSKLSDFSKMFEAVAGSYDRVFIVVDALDECSAMQREDLISQLRALQKWNVKLMATSRRIDTISEEFDDFENNAILEVIANGEDIKRFIQAELPRLARCVQKNDILKGLVTSTIIGAADGMFILARLLFELLIGQSTERKIKTTLESLPRGFKELSKAYDRTINRMENKSSGYTSLAWTVIAWIVNAERPLSVRELQHALATETGDTKLPEDNFTDISDVLSACVGLVIVDGQNETVRLVHYTAYEYLTENWMPSISALQRDIAETCITYLLFETFHEGHCINYRAVDARLASHAFYDYAAKNWGYHVDAASMQEESFVLKFLNNEAKVSACAQVGICNSINPMEFQESGVTAMHLAAHFGLVDTMVALHNAGHYLHPWDIKQRTPLFYATRNGQEQAIRWFLDVTSEHFSPTMTEDLEGETLLFCAVARGQDSIFPNHTWRDPIVHCGKQRTPPDCKATTTGEIDPDSRDNDGHTPLSTAAFLGLSSVVKLLLSAKDVNPNSEDNWGQTPLLLAVARRHLEVIKLLLSDDRVEPNTRDKEGRTVLLRAAHTRSIALVQLLFSYSRVKPDCRDSSGRTLLSHAAAESSVELIQYLLSDDRVDPNSRDIAGRTPFSWPRLLAQGCFDLNSKDLRGWTPFRYAADKERFDTMELLLSERSFDLESEVLEDQTLLSWAAERWYHQVLDQDLEEDQILNGLAQDLQWTPSLLSEIHVDVDWRRREIQYSRQLAWSGIVTILVETKDEDQTCTESWFQLVVELLYWQNKGSLAQGALRQRIEHLVRNDLIQPDFRDDSGRTLLWWAAKVGDEMLVKLLLMKGADPEPKDSFGRTPLLYAAMHGYNKIVELLLKDERIDSEHKDNDGLTALALAAWQGYDTTTGLLLEKNRPRVDTHVQGNNFTPMSLAAGNGQHGMVKRLLSDSRFDPSSLDDSGRTPLFYAAMNGHEKVVQLLLDDDRVSRDLKDDFGMTPLFAAAVRGYQQVVERFLSRDGIDPNAMTNNPSRTALHFAADRGDSRIVELLLGMKGINPDPVDISGATPLWLAAFQGHSRVVELLLATKAVDLLFRGD